MAMKKTFFWKENTSIVQRLRPLCPDSCPHGYPHLWKSHFPLTQQPLVEQNWWIILANNRILVPRPGRIPLRCLPPMRKWRLPYRKNGKQGIIVRRKRSIRKAWFLRSLRPPGRRSGRSVLRSVDLQKGSALQGVASPGPGNSG